MTLNYEFIEMKRQYLLKLNGLIHSVYNKHFYSRQEAEDKASEEVMRSIKKYGPLVNYDGMITI